MSPVRAAQRAEMAVAIAILLVAPIRIKNLRMIEIGRQLRHYVERMILSFEEDEVKNAVPLEFEIDLVTAELIQHQIAPANSVHLFAGKFGGAHGLWAQRALDEGTAQGPRPPR